MGETLTRRQELETLVELKPWTLRELAADLGRPIREVQADLEHVIRSRGRKALALTPAECSQCGFVFDKRDRLTAPSRCPRCRTERIDGPWFELVGSD